VKVAIIRRSGIGGMVPFRRILLSEPRGGGYRTAALHHRQDRGIVSMLTRLPGPDHASDVLGRDTRVEHMRGNLGPPHGLK